MESYFPLEMHFVPRADDYARGVRAFYKQQPITRYIIFVLLFMLVMSICMVIVLGTEFLILAQFLVGFPLLILVSYFMLAPALNARQVQKNERLRTETTWIVTDERIKITNHFSETSFDWATFRTFVETDALFLMVYSTNKNMFQILPKRAFQTEEQQQLFRTLLAQKLDPR